MEFITNSPEETEAVGMALGKLLTPGTVIAYQGDLGAGKTAFTRGVACGLGAKESVTSPTYTTGSISFFSRSSAAAFLGSL